MPGGEPEGWLFPTGSGTRTPSTVLKGSGGSSFPFSASRLKRRIVGYPPAPSTGSDSDFNPETLLKKLVVSLSIPDMLLNPPMIVFVSSRGAPVFNLRFTPELL